MTVVKRIHDGAVVENKQKKVQVAVALVGQIKKIRI